LTKWLERRDVGEWAEALSAAIALKMKTGLIAWEKAQAMKSIHCSLILLAFCPPAYAQELPNAPSVVMKQDAAREICVLPVRPPELPNLIRPHLGNSLAAGQSIRTGEIAPSPYHNPRGHKKLLALAGVVGFEVAANHYDVSETEKGLKAGVATEESAWLVGSKPSAVRLYARDMLVLGITASPSVIAYAWRRTEYFYGGFGAPVILAVKHIYGGNAWRRLLKATAPSGISNSRGMSKRY
jgi:hypothetical protein